MRLPYVFISMLCMLSGSPHAQSDVFPDLYGEELIEALSDQYYPEALLPLSDAKDIIYSEIDLGTDDSVRCIYTDRAIFLPDGEDPSQAVFMNGSGINLEHIWPQSKGAGDGMPGQSDMHHLAPSRVDVNSARANNPFAESPDNLTDAWFYLNYSMSSIPQQMIDAYSEADNHVFEPRENRKGDIARAMFYFYTIHNADADQAFFDSQLATLCAWSLADPVDAEELERAERIAAHQGNLNPFLLDCTLPARAFCGEQFNCTTSSVSSQPDADDIVQKIYVLEGYLKVESTFPTTGTLHCRLISISGVTQTEYKRKVLTGPNEISFPTRNIPAGLYIFSMGYETGGNIRQLRPQKVVLH